MAFKSMQLPPGVQDKINATRDAEQGYRAVFANLCDEDLAASAKFWMAHCDAPRRIEPGQPVYDSTFWHVIVPEMIKRLGAPVSDDTDTSNETSPTVA